MKVKRIALIFGLLLYFVSSCKSQILSATDSLYQSSAELIIKNYFNEQIEGKPILIYSIGTNNHLIIIENLSTYVQYVVCGANHSIVNTSTIHKPDSILDKAFTPSNYLDGFTTTKSAFFKNGYTGTSTFNNSAYFVLIDANKNRYGEARIPIVVNPNPIPNDVYLYLYKLLVKNLDLCIK